MAMGICISADLDIFNSKSYEKNQDASMVAYYLSTPAISYFLFKRFQSNNLNKLIDIQVLEACVLLHGESHNIRILILILLVPAKNSELKTKIQK